MIRWSAVGSDGKGRPRRALNPIDLYVRAPLGLLWMVVLTILTLPVMIYMTLLYYLVQGAARLGRKRSPRDRADREERVA
jgi:uncharacterized membrane protein